MTVEVFREETWDFPLKDPSNRFYVRAGGYRILIDAGARPLPSQPGADFILITHWHWDHTYGLSSISDIKVCMDKATLASINPSRARESMIRVARATGFEENTDAVKLMEAFAGRYSAIENALSRLEVYSLEECFPVKAGVVSYIKCPGHSEDHVCYIIGGHAFVGDNILSSAGTVTLINLLSYNESMIRIMANPQWRIAHPGHGHSLQRGEALEWFIKHYRHKEKRLLQVLSRIPSGSWISVRRLMELVYGKGESIAMYMAARTLIGYINTLETNGIIEVDRSQSPWMVKVKSG